MQALYNEVMSSGMNDIDHGEKSYEAQKYIRAYNNRDENSILDAMQDTASNSGLCSNDPFALRRLIKAWLNQSVSH